MSEPNKAAQELGRLGGKKSVESRLGGKTKEEISEAMKTLRRARMNLVADAILPALNSVPKKDQF